MSRHSQARPAALSDYDEVAGKEKGIIREAWTGKAPVVVRQPIPPSKAPSQTPRGRSSTFADPTDMAIRSRTPAATASIVQIGRSTSRSQAPPTAPLPPLQRSSSTSRRQSIGCTDPTCGDPNCQSVRNTERRFVLPERPAAVPLQPAIPAYGHPSLQSQPTVPSAVPRVRANSFVSRPQSWTGAHYFTHYAPPSATRVHQGPPLSPSAWRHIQFSQQCLPYQTQTSYVASPINTVPAFQIPSTPTYPPSPMNNQPFMPPFDAPREPALQSQANEMYRARLPEYPTRLSSRVQEPRRLVRSHSINAREPWPMPGSFPDEDAIGESSDSDYDEDDYNPRKRDSKMMPPPSRPALTIARPSTRTIARPGPSTSARHGSDSRSSSYADSDRTPRQSGLRRQTSAASSRSRHHSVSTGASSHRTPATTVSTGSRVEYGDGHLQFSAAEDRARLQKFEAQQKVKAQQIADAESYQNTVRGNALHELTDDTMRQFSGTTSAPRSRASVHSRRSGQSGSQSEGIKISYGETTMHVTGGARVEMQNDVDGTPRIVINPGMSREKSYYTETSKSSESRVGRSRGGSDRRRPTLEAQ